MRYYLCLLVVAICEAGRITRGVDYSLFPNFQAVYHGHGATSYQNVQIDNHDSIKVPTNYGDPEEIKHLEHHSNHQSVIIPIIEPNNDIEHIDISESAPYEEYAIAELTSDVLEHYFDQYDEGYEFEPHV